MRTHLSLFSGIGGLDLAAEWAGFTTVGQCEWADYPTKVLERHWPDVPRWRDIRTLTKESFYEKTGLRTVDVVSGGFPCQPFSVAGKRRGREDDRYLWPEMLRVISELRPAWVVGENVAGIVSMALDTVLSDLESLGYTCQAIIIPACAVDAPHRRDRCAIVAYADCIGLEKPGMQGLPEKQGASAANGGWWPTEPGVGRSLDGVSCWLDGIGWLSSDALFRLSHGAPSLMSESWEDNTWENGIERVATGVPHRVDRLKCLGNAVVPQQFYPIFRAIMEVTEV